MRDSYLSSIKLDKGEYIITVQICHNNISYLEKLQDLILLVDFNIKSISLDVYDTFNSCLLQQGFFFLFYFILYFFFSFFLFNFSFCKIMKY